MGNNRIELKDREYLKNNFSNFEYKHFPSKQPFMTSNMRDFKEIEIYENTSKKKSNKEKSSLINASQVVLGEYTSKCNPKSTYEDLYNNPKERKSH
jgi:hypothetical protein